MAYIGLFNKAQFQNDAFQTGLGQSITLLGGGADVSKEWLKKHGFQYPYQEQKIREQKEALQKLDKKLSKAQSDKLKAQISLENEKKKKAQEKYTKQLQNAIALEAKAQEEIRLMLIERQRLIRQIDEEECLIVLYSLPFIN